MPRQFHALALGTLTLASITISGSAYARDFDRGPLPFCLDLGNRTDRPVEALGEGRLRFSPDTLLFGNIGVDGFAVADDVWDWDGPLPGDPLQGWYAVDVSQQSTAFFRQITAASWATGSNLVAAPLLNGAGSLWVGAFENAADALCWDAGLGYGNNWCQRALSPVLGYTGAGNISLSFEYFNDTEPDFDYSKVILRRLPSGEEVALNFDGFTDQIGLATNHPTGIPVGAIYADVIGPGDLQGETQFQLVFEFTSDGGLSDEDGAYATDYSGFGADDVALSGSLTGGNVTYTFNSTIEGWTTLACPGFGDQMGIRGVGLYTIEDPCGCELSGNVLEFHNSSFVHEYGQHSYGVSNPVDVANDVPDPAAGFNTGILANWDQYSVMPRANGVFYRPGWDYYPFTCPQTGAVQWSGRVGQDNYLYVGNDPLCIGSRNVGTDFSVPGVGLEQVRFIFEVYASCDEFGIPPDVCTEITNFTPIIDNVQIGFTEVPHAPAIAFASGTRYQDTFAITDLLDPNGVGRADVVINVNFGNTAPYIAGDSLHVSGPSATSSTRWESRLWFRINREGPGTKPPKYNAWKTAIADGRNITGGQFTFAWMDSFQLGTQTAKNKFVSFLRDSGEDDFNWDGSGEFGGNNEIIRDDILVAGTGIDYFVTSNFTVSPTLNFLLPDTTGQFFNEFSVLPNWGYDGSTFKFPSLLYVDAFNGGAEYFITTALDALGEGYDKYDYLDASSNWKNPMARGATNAEQSGVPLMQLLGYKTILVNTGTLAGQTMWPQDFVLLSDWLTATVGSNQCQGLIFNGDNTATILESTGSAFLTLLGAVQVEDAYNGYGGTPDENYCVSIEAPPSAQYPPTIEYDAFGNWCPEQFSFDILAPVQGGVGNRAYAPLGAFAQIAKVAERDYCTVLDGISYHHLTATTGPCVGDEAGIVAAVTAELGAALDWMRDGACANCEPPESCLCGPEPHWIHDPACPPGEDNMPTGALAGIDTNLDCVRDFNVVMSGPVRVRRTGPLDDSVQFPGTRPVDAHLDVSDTEIESMSLGGGGVVLTAGEGLGSIPLLSSLGTIAEQPNHPHRADSFFDVFFEINNGGTRYYNQTPLRLNSVIYCIPPHAVYVHPNVCLPLYTSPNPGQGVHVANLVTANHTPFPQPGACCHDDECVEITANDCESQGGLFRGESTTCEPTSCPSASEGACCMDVECVVLPQVECIDRNGAFQGPGVSCAPLPCVPTGVPEEPPASPLGPALLGNVPNPIHSQTTIRYRATAAAEVEIEIHDATGRVLRRLVGSAESAGPHGVIWDGRDAHGRPVPTGIYQYKLRISGEELTGKLTVIR